MNAREVFWKKKMTIPGTVWTLSGYSRAAFRSGFFIKELDCMLDAGPQSHVVPKHIFITHSHGDHIANLPFTLIRDTEVKGYETIPIYAPIETKEFLHNYIQSLFSLNSLQDVSEDVRKSYDFIGVTQERTISRLKMNGNEIELETVGADHPVPTTVYGFSLIKKKLDDKFKGLSGKEIATLRKKGTEVMKELVEKKFAYILDTSIEIFKNSPFLLSYPCIVIECTFLLPDELENSIRTKHIHWQQLKPYIIDHPEIEFILVHFSLRYKDTEIKEFFDKELQELQIKNVRPWLSDLDN
jgi:ribonuclease Z